MYTRIDMYAVINAYVYTYIHTLVRACIFLLHKRGADIGLSTQTAVDPSVAHYFKIH